MADNKKKKEKSTYKKVMDNLFKTPSKVAKGDGDKKKSNKKLEAIAKSFRSR